MNMHDIMYNLTCKGLTIQHKLSLRNNIDGKNIMYH